jgi:hypothetical protein
LLVALLSFPTPGTDFPEVASAGTTAISQDSNAVVDRGPLQRSQLSCSFSTIAGRVCNGTEQVAQTDTSSTTMKDDPDAPINQIPDDSPPSPNEGQDAVQQMESHWTPEYKAALRAVDQLTTVLANNAPPIAAIAPQGTEGHRVIVVRTTGMTPDLEHRIPPSINGFPVKVYIGKAYTQPNPALR